MALFLVVAFLIVPIVEIYVITQVAGGLGWLTTIALVIAVSIVGAWLVRAQGLATLSRMQRRLAAGEVPGREILDGVLILVAGALMLTPGFVTDGVGLFLLLPPTRALARTWLTHRYRDRISYGGTTTFTTGFGTRFYRSGDVVDTTEADDGGPSSDTPNSGREPGSDYGPDELGRG